MLIQHKCYLKRSSYLPHLLKSKITPNLLSFSRYRMQVLESCLDFMLPNPTVGKACNHLGLSPTYFFPQQPSCLFQQPTAVLLPLAPQFLLSPLYLSDAFQAPFPPQSTAQKHNPCQLCSSISTANCLGRRQFPHTPRPGRNPAQAAAKLYPTGRLEAEAAESKTRGGRQLLGVHLWPHPRLGARNQSCRCSLSSLIPIAALYARDSPYSSACCWGGGGEKKRITPSENFRCKVWHSCCMIQPPHLPLARMLLYTRLQ